MYPDFIIQPGKAVSNKFIELGHTNFASAAQYVKTLEYKRNTDKHDPLVVLKEKCGTCSTKHALLALLAEENNQHEFSLKLGIFRMGQKYSSPVGTVLSKYGLDFIPEAHNYLHFNGQILDYTNAISAKEDFMDDLIMEITISPEEITDFKVSYHRDMLQKWITYTPINYNLEQVWDIREECIAALSSD